MSAEENMALARHLRFHIEEQIAEGDKVVTWHTKIVLLGDVPTVASVLGWVRWSTRRGFSHPTI